MENKYYIPEYSDIHIGQELYTIDGYIMDLSTVDSLTWFLQCQNCYIDCEENTTYGISLENYKLKYLDSSDIEELGFEHIESTENGVNFIKHIDNPKQSIHLTLFNANHRVGIAVYNFNVNPPMVCEEIGTFGGIIKNKSELKKVLNMLNIK